MKLEIIIAMLLALLVVGGIWIISPKHVIETPAAEIKQADGSIVVARKPDAKAKPKHQVPKGSKVERIEQVTVQGETPAEITACTAVKCPPVTVDMTLVRMPDNTKRVVASSPDGQIVASVDIPVEAVVPPPEPKEWAAGISLNPVQQTAGVWIERDIWRVRVGAELNQVRPVIGVVPGVEARIRLGWTF